MFTNRGPRLNDPLSYMWHITLSLSSCRGVCMLAVIHSYIFVTKVSASLPWMDGWWRHRVAAVCKLTILVSLLYRYLFSLLICEHHQLNANIILVNFSFSWACPHTDDTQSVISSLSVLNYNWTSYCLIRNMLRKNLKGEAGRCVLNRVLTNT